MKIISTLIAFGIMSAVVAKEADAFKLIHVKDLSTLLQQKAVAPAIFDANNPETRTKYGVIPGATLLTNYKKYDIAKTLPAAKDAQLVFYCANTQCMASHAAAQHAVEAGYTKVAVMADGIQGWNAGKPVTKVQ